MDVETRQSVFNKPEYVISDPTKKKITYTVYQPTNEFALWEIKPATGPVPSELAGKYTSFSSAIEDTKKYLRKLKVKYGSKLHSKPQD